jgi:hypothetical protein
LSVIYDEARWNLTDVDILVYNSDQRQLPFVSQIKASRVINVQTWKPALEEMQIRDLGRYFGADNPWITNPPDGHPCMPGMPDDEVHLLLYSLLTGYNVVLR